MDALTTMLIENGTISPEFFGTAFRADEIFGSLPPTAEKNLRAVTERRRFGAGETIFARGQEPSYVCFLREGAAQIIYRDEQLGRMIAVNEILGFTEALSNLPYETALRTLTPCLFDRIRRDDFLDFLQNEPEICFRLLQTLGADLQKLFRLLH